MTRCVLTAVLLTLLTASVGWAEGEGAAKLRNNPFVQPVVAAPKPKPARVVRKQPPQEERKTVQAPEPPPAPPWTPELRGTVVAGPRSLANVGGVILMLGDELDGYRLREVRTAEAVFQGGGGWVLVPLGGEPVPMPDPTDEGTQEIAPQPLSEGLETQEGALGPNPDAAAVAIVEGVGTAVSKERADPASDGLAAHGLQVGVFRSQLYLREQEAKLSELGVPHARLRSTGTGDGHRVTIAAPGNESPSGIRETLTAHGYAFEESGRGLEVHLYLDTEVDRLIGLLEEAGIPNHAEPTRGDLPRWTLLAGPFTRAQANRERVRLSGHGVSSHLRSWPSGFGRDLPARDYGHELVARSPTDAARKAGRE